jgi:hypothetical protein
MTGSFGIIDSAARKWERTVNETIAQAALFNALEQALSRHHS